MSLTHFSPGIGDDEPSDIDMYKIIEEMKSATDTLIKWLPAYQCFPFGLPCPEEVAIALHVLPSIRKDLDRFTKRHMGRPLNANRDICAAVVTKAWKLLYGKIEPQSLKLQQACGEYWRACGGKQIGGWDEPENWRRPIERVSAAEFSWIEDFMSAISPT